MTPPTNTAQNPPTTIYFLRRGRINLNDENLDILPTSIISELGLAPKKIAISIDNLHTQGLINERKKSVPLKDIQTIYSAESIRCQRTAQLIQETIVHDYGRQINITPIHLLNEVQFRIDKILPSFTSQFKYLDKNQIDQSIFHSMINDLDWSESAKQCLWRISYFFDIIKKRELTGPILCVTHDYIMRIIELFIRKCGEDEHISIEELRSTQRNYPLHGFYTDTTLSFFKPLPESPSAIPIPTITKTSLGHQADPLLVSVLPLKETQNNIYFIRHSKLNLPYNGHNYIPSGIIRELSQSSLDPSIDKWFTKELILKRAGSLPFEKIGVIFTATSSRSQSTASAIQDYIFQQSQKQVDTFTFPYIDEIKFNFQRIYPGSMDEFEKIDIDLLNLSVLKAMIAGQDCESLRQIYWKIDYFFEIIQKYENRGKILVITHDYLMRAIELYIKRKHFTTVTLEDILHTQHNGYLEGFSTDFAMSHFTPLPKLAKT